MPAVENAQKIKSMPQVGRIKGQDHEPKAGTETEDQDDGRENKHQILFRLRLHLQRLLGEASRLIPTLMYSHKGIIGRPQTKGRDLYIMGRGKRGKNGK